MSEREMKNDVEPDEFTDELWDEALDQEQRGGKTPLPPPYCYCGCRCR